VRCPRLAAFLADVRAQYPAYHAKPVSAFGAARPRLLIVGLAPGLHGANATGRPFTGDHAGVLLYKTLHKHGFSNQPQGARLDDGLILKDCRITNAVKCVPPGNKPTPAEIHACNDYLRSELALLGPGIAILALGRIAHESVLRALGVKGRRYPFAHAAEFELPQGGALVDSYHCSRYNTQTGRLTEAMFDVVFEKVKRVLERAQ
jgi:uracil-DNA glycosylase family 4